MIWLIAIGSSIYTMVLIVLGIFVGYQLCKRMTTAAHQTRYTSSTQTISDEKPRSPILKHDQSGALKSITPLERSLEQSKEIRERIEDLLS